MILTRKKYPVSDTDLLIKQCAQEQRLSSLLIIVPTNRKSRTLKKELINISGGKVTGRINIETLGTFCQKMHSEISSAPFQLLSEAAAAVLMKRSFNTVPLNYFNRYKAEVPSGTLLRIKNIISEYKRHGVSPDHLLKESRKLEVSERLKTEDIARLFEYYNEECRKTNTGEIGDIYSDLLKSNSGEFGDVYNSLFPGADLVIINGFDEFTSPEIEIISRISESGKDVLISFDYSENNPGLFLHLRECFDTLASRGFFKTGGDSPAENEFRSVIRDRFFSGNPAAAMEGFNLKLLTALDKEKEIELIAKQLKLLINDEDVRPDRICVVFNLIQNYSHIIRNKFSEYRLPFNLTDRVPLSSSGPVTAVITFLEILENDFYYKSIFRSLSSGFISLNGVSLSELIETSSDLKIIGGYLNWTQSIEQGLKVCEKQKINTYSSALQSIKTILNILLPLREKLDIPGFRNSLFRIIDRLCIPENILGYGAETEIFFKALASFYEMLAELFTLLENEYGDKKTFPLSFYLDQIRTAADNSRFNITEKSGYGVQVTNLDEIRGLSFDYLFIGGLTDGELPTRYSPEIFLSGSYSREEWKHQVEERYRFYQSLCTWEKGLYLSRPLQDENKELAPSNFLSELKNQFVIPELNESDFADSVFSNLELQDYAGQRLSKLPEAEKEFDSIPGINPAEIKLIREISLQRMQNTKSPYNGYILSLLSESNKELLKKVRNKNFSASQLEVYASCPFKYFLERIMNLNVAEEPAEEMESIELGRLIHTILYEFYKTVRERGITISGCSDSDFASVQELMFNIADLVIEESAGKSPLNFLEIERLKGLNGDRRKSVLFNFLLAEREPGGNYNPYDFEVPFGNLRGEDSGKDFYAGSVKVRGKIDRIDINNSENLVKVTDYKLSGKKPTAEELENGLSLQLPLYLYAARQIIIEREKKELIAGGADIYSLKYQKKNFGRKPVISEKRISPEQASEEYERLISICIESINRYAEGISRGVYNLSNIPDRENKICAYCKFNFVCRVNENC